MKRFLLIAAGLGPAALVAGPIDDVRCREIGFSRSIESRNIEAFKSFLDRDARFIGATVRRGPEEVSESWSVFTQEDGPRIRWRPVHIEVLDDGKLALSRGIYETLVTAEDGTERRSYGSFNSTWRLNGDGVWRIVFDAGDPWAREPTEEELALLDQDGNCGD